MNKKLLVGIIVAVIVVAGVVWLAMRPGATTSEVASTQNQPSPAQPVADQSSSKTLRELMAAGGNVTCTVAQADSGVQSSGSMYISGGKVRYDFAVPGANGTTTAAHSLVMDMTSYMWTDGQAMGIKMKFDPSEKAQALTPASSGKTQGSLDPDQQISQNCQPWTVDQSKFTLPSGVEFRELSMPAVGAPGSAEAAAGATMPAGQASPCDNLPEPSKSQCIAAMKSK